GAASLEAARLRGREPRRAPRAAARRAHRQVSVSVPPRRPGRAPRGSGAQSPASCGGLSGAATRAAARDRRPRANQPPERIARALALAAAVPLVRGLVAGGSILTGGAQAWLAGEKSDETATVEIAARLDRKSTRLNSSHRTTSYAVFCLKKKNQAHWNQFLSHAQAHP